MNLALRKMKTSTCRPLISSGDRQEVIEERLEWCGLAI